MRDKLFKCEGSSRDTELTSTASREIYDGTPTF